MNITSIAIVIADNDFHLTISNLICEVANKLYCDSTYYGNTVEEAEVSIKAKLRDFYVHYQINPRIMPTRQHTENVVEYLHRKVRVLFNEEADVSFNTKDYDHGSWYVSFVNVEADIEPRSF